MAATSIIPVAAQMYA